MTDQSKELNTAFARVVALTWRGVWLNLIVVALCGVSLWLATYHRPFPWTGALIGVIVGLSGYQLWLAHGQFARLGTNRPHSWVRPVGVILLAVGVVLLLFGVLAGMRRLAAT